MTKITRIEYKCIKAPESVSLKGFMKGNIYKGRTFNDLFEISTEWASHHPTYLIEKKEFEKYFVLTNDFERLKTLEEQEERAEVGNFLVKKAKV